MTALFPDVIFGPVRSRRLGLSLGVNLLPTDAKLCNFNCIYCECGWNSRNGGNAHGGLLRCAPPRDVVGLSCAYETKDGEGDSDTKTATGPVNAPKPLRFNSRDDVKRLLAQKLREMAAAGECPDVITFAGNGEPTTHPDFETIIDDTIALRDELCPFARVSVLSNATMIGRESVRRALEKVDNNILKLDSAMDDTVRLINGPQGAFSLAETVRLMKEFGGRCIVQTMFLRGELGGELGEDLRGVRVDNTSEREVEAWLRAVAEIAPRQVMIYTIDRDTPVEGLEKVPVEELRAIAARVEALGIPTVVAG